MATAKHRNLIEVCANSVESALAAQEGGADRVRCDNLLEGGTTPSHGTVSLARGLLQIGLYVIVRPRGGDFCYSDVEFQIMKEDVADTKALGADGVVFGILTKDGRVDTVRCGELIGLARPMGITFHRAFDMTQDPGGALRDIPGNLRFDRILTSGHANQAAHGVSELAALVELADGQISIMPGSGINETNIADLARRTRAKEFHVSVRKRVDSAMTFRNETISMGGGDSGSEYTNLVTDAERVRLVVSAANSIE